MQNYTEQEWNVTLSKAIINSDSENILPHALDHFATYPQLITENIARFLKLLVPDLKFLFYSSNSADKYGWSQYAIANMRVYHPVTCISSDYNCRSYKWEDKILVGISPPMRFTHKKIFSTSQN